MNQSVIAIIFGGCSTEYEISLQSAYAILSHFNRKSYVPLPIGITREGQWFLYSGPITRIQDDSWHQEGESCFPCVLSLDRTKHELLVFSGSVVHYKLDAAFPVLHGKNGEDGTIQGLLELAGIPVIGCGSLSSALCMDKDRAHKLAALAGISTPKSFVISPESIEKSWEQAAEEIGYPLFVKPVRSGSSFGITKVTSSDELVPAIQKAAYHDNEILLEETIPGFEVGCAVMGNQTLTVGMVDEIELSSDFFNYEEKYTLKTSKIHCPARISEGKADEIQDAAKKIYRALGCRGFARVDLFLTPDGKIVFNEVNTIPGFTSHSRYPNMMKGIGLTFDQLVSQLVALGMEN
jgi:D-alanine---D-serine ligase